MKGSFLNNMFTLILINNPTSIVVDRHIESVVDDYISLKEECVEPLLLPCEGELKLAGDAQVVP